MAIRQPEFVISRSASEAVLFDLDGVVTQPAKVYTDTAIGSWAA